VLLVCGGWKAGPTPHELKIEGSFFIIEALKDSPKDLDRLIVRIAVL
jgi:hypothetical protein